MTNQSSGQQIDCDPDGKSLASQHSRLLTAHLARLIELLQQAENDARAATWEHPDEVATRLAATRSAVRDAAPTQNVESAAASTSATRRAFDNAERAIGDLHLAVLSEQLSLRQNEPRSAGSTDSSSSMRAVLTQQSSTVARAVRDEMAYLLKRKPRKVIRALLIGTLSGAAYLVWIRFSS